MLLRLKPELGAEHQVRSHPKGSMGARPSGDETRPLRGHEVHLPRLRKNARLPGCREMSGDYGLLAIASAMERSAALLEEAAKPPQSPVTLKGRAAFLKHVATVLRGWIPQQAETEDDIL